MLELQLFPSTKPRFSNIFRQHTITRYPLFPARLNSEQHGRVDFFGGWIWETGRVWKSQKEKVLMGRSFVSEDDSVFYS